MKEIIKMYSFCSWVKKDPDSEDNEMFKILFKFGTAVYKMEHFLRINLFRPMTHPFILASDLRAISSGWDQRYVGFDEKQYFKI